MKSALYIFGQLTDLDIEWMARHGRHRLVAAGDVLIRKGVAIDALFIIFQGRFAITTEAGAVVSHMRGGDVAGEMSLVQSGLPTATVAAVESSEVLDIPRGVLNEKLQADPGFASRFYRGIAILLSDRLVTKNRVLNRLKQAIGGDKEIWEIEDEVSHQAGGRLEMAELDMEVLDAVHLAGERFRRLQESATRASGA